MPKIQITEENAKEFGFSRAEFEALCLALGRFPDSLEIKLLSIVHSEAISKKSARKWIDRLPREGEFVICDENDIHTPFIKIGQGVACALHVESQNHRSAFLPYHGAAFAVENASRELAASGARPLAHLNSLRFGDFDNPKTALLIKNIVKAVSDYSRGIGSPVAGGEVFFNESFNETPLVNIIAVGTGPANVLLRQHLPLTPAPDDLIYIVGNPTTNIITDQPIINKYPPAVSEDEVPAYHNNPVEEKNIISAVSELIVTELVMKTYCLKDGGLIAALARLQQQLLVGATIELEHIPFVGQEPDAFLLLSAETQGRFLVVVPLQHKQRVEKLLNDRQVSFGLLGRITTDKSLVIRQQNEALVSFFPQVIEVAMTEIEPRIYTRPEATSSKKFPTDVIPQPIDLQEVGLFLLQHKNIASKRWFTARLGVHEQKAPPILNSDAAIIDVEGADYSLVFGADCNARYVDANPQEGAAIAVAEAARNIVCCGAKPAAIALGLNFGDYDNPEIFGQFVEVIKGVNKMARLYHLPVVSVNVSVDNMRIVGQKRDSIYPTPVIGMIGLMKDRNKKLTLHFKSKGDMIFLLGESRNEFNSSIYLKSYHRVRKSPAPYFNMHTAYNLMRLITELNEKGLINSAHDISNGGLFVTLFEAALPLGLGFDITTDAEIREDAFLFGEAQNRIVVTVNSDKETDFIDYMIEKGFPFSTLGHVTKGEIRIDDESWGFTSAMRELYENALEQLINQNS